MFLGKVNILNLIHRKRSPVSLRLGHASALTVHWTVIHYLGAASLPKGEGNLFLRIAPFMHSRGGSPDQTNIFFILLFR